MILKYITFNFSEEFEKWQEDNPDFIVVQITPIVSGLDLQVDEDKKQAGGNTRIKVFIIYKDESQRHLSREMS